MKNTDFYLLMDELLEKEPGTITGVEVLSELESWDSLKVVELMALLDERYHIEINVDILLKSATVADVAKHLATHVEA